jgi:hypothetical protein
VHVRRVVVAVAVVGLAASGCSSEPQSGELDLESDEVAAAPATPDPPAEVTEEPSQPSESPEDDQLYPPLPPLEPDLNSDVSVEDQQFFLELHSRVYTSSQRSFAQAVVDPQLDEYVGGDALREIEETVATWADQGLVQLSPDAEVRWIEVADLRNGQFVVRECSVTGPRTGLYDASSGEPVELLDEPGATVIETSYSLTDIDGDIDYRALSVATSDDRERCDVG